MPSVTAGTNPLSGALQLRSVALTNVSTPVAAPAAGHGSRSNLSAKPTIASRASSSVRRVSACCFASIWALNMRIALAPRMPRISSTIASSTSEKPCTAARLSARRGLRTDQDDFVIEAGGAPRAAEHARGDGDGGICFLAGRSRSAPGRVLDVLVLEVAREGLVLRRVRVDAVGRLRRGRRAAREHHQRAGLDIGLAHLLEPE